MTARLLESVVAILLVSLMARAGLEGVERAAKLLAAGARQAKALSTARNLLEHERIAPCSPPPDCPEGLRCRVRRQTVTASSGGPGLFRVRVDVFTSTSSRKPAAWLVTLTRRSRRRCATAG